MALLNWPKSKKSRKPRLGEVGNVFVENLTDREKLILAALMTLRAETAGTSTIGEERRKAERQADRVIQLFTRFFK